MKLIYNSEADKNLLDYGVFIPLKADRAEKIITELQKRVEVPKPTPIPKRLSINDYYRIHDKEFIDAVHAENSKAQEKYFVDCYELIDSEGNFNRYNPLMAKKNWTHALSKIKSQVELTLETLIQAREYGSAFFLGGGMHHSMSFSGRGFCLFHDGLIGLSYLKNIGAIDSAWIIDVDAHKGDGAPEIIQKKNIDYVKTLSFHMADSWPLTGERNDRDGNLNPWFIPSDIDIEHREGEEANYLKKLEAGLMEMEKKFSLPDIAWIALGSDPYEYDELPSTASLKLSKEVMLARDLLIYKFFKSRNIPQAFVMAGGYGDHVYKIYLQFLEKVELR